jgi:hypothetical protein
MAGILVLLSALRALYVRGDVGMTSLEFLQPLTTWKCSASTSMLRWASWTPSPASAACGSWKCTLRGASAAWRHSALSAHCNIWLFERIGNVSSLVPLFYLSALTFPSIWIANAVSVREIMRLSKSLGLMTA